MCYCYLIDTILISEIVTLVNDMHDCANRIIDYFSGKSVESVSNSPSRGTVPGACNATAGSASDSLASNPAKLCFVVKQSLQECAIGKSFNFSNSSLLIPLKFEIIRSLSRGYCYS